MYFQLNRISLLLFFVIIGCQPLLAQNDENSTSDPVLIKKIADSISLDPNNSGLHERYLAATGFAKYGAKDDPTFVEQYKKWMKQYPKSAVLPFALGHAYWSKESPAAKPYLLKALELSPRMDKAYFELWIDADRWGKFKEGLEYLRKAKEIAPDDPNYAFYYALSFKDDPAKTETLVLDMAKKFPNNDRTKGAIYIVALQSKNFDTRVKFYELLKEKFPVASIIGYMNNYFDLLLMPQTKKAATLATEMMEVSKDQKSKDMWTKQVNWAVSIERAKEFVKDAQYDSAIKILDTIQLNKRMNSFEGFLILKSQAYKNNNRLDDAYNMLLNYYSFNPSDRIKEQMYAYGLLLNKSKETINTDVWMILDKAAQKATSFSLNKYPATSGKMSLDNLKGKVVLLTYWFPGCGPCRGEFPHFQNVVDQFKGKGLEYIGVNIEASQNDYVIPFMQHSSYTFTPLEDFEGRERGNMSYVGAPTNYLLDKEGRIIYKNFRTDEHNEDVLKNMIEIVMSHS